MKVSIITVVWNNKETIRDAINSVLSQTYKNIEYIVIDGSSTDGTLEIIQNYSDKISMVISEPDKGVYDALNKGIREATGDVIAILHSDDKFFNEHVVLNMMKHMDKEKSELCFSDAVIVDGSSGRIMRYYMAHYFKKWMFIIGWMPPHPTCFIEKSLFDEFGLYSTNYKIAGDFDLLVKIFYGREIRWSYLDQVTVKMSTGGISNSGWRSKKLVYSEINRSLKSNNVWSMPVFQLARYAIRLMEIIIRPKKHVCD